LTSKSFEENGFVEKIKKALDVSAFYLFSKISTNPDLDDLEVLNAQYKSKQISVIIALGGGSVIDSAKVLSVTLLSNVEKPLTDLFRNGLSTQWIQNIPVIALPTTAGTGAEVTPFATVWDNRFNKKYSLLTDNIFPKFAILDAALTLTLSQEQTLYSGLDAISHALESLWNKNRTPLSELYALQALQLLNQSLPLVMIEPHDIQSRANMQQASLLAGLAISQTKTAIAHSISYPLTSHYGVPHGLACSFTLANIITFYLTKNPNSSFKVIMIRTQNMLMELNLFKHIEQYATPAQIHSVKAEMFNPDRVGNFDLDVDDFSSLLRFESSSPLV
jgi:alcohol dehydrogenase